MWAAAADAAGVQPSDLAQSFAMRAAMTLSALKALEAPVGAPLCIAADDGGRLPHRLRTHSRHALPHDPTLREFAARHEAVLDAELVEQPTLAALAARAALAVLRAGRALGRTPGRAPRWTRCWPRCWPRSALGFPRWPFTRSGAP